MPRALRWHTERGDDDMVQCLTELLTIVTPDWPDGMSVGTAVHRTGPAGVRSFNDRHQPVGRSEAPILDEAAN